MKFHSTPLAALVALYSIGSAFAGGEGWISDFEAAKKQAAAEKKDMLLDFTGSDWCGWCIKLNDEVFKKDEFKKGVKDKFVLVELDFPQDVSKISEATKKQNAELQSKYGIMGFPSIVLCDAAGKPFAKTGYAEGGPEKYVVALDDLRKKKSKRDAAFASAAKAEGVAKAQLLVSALKEMDLSDAEISNFYPEVTPQIKASDPKDQTGFIKNIEAKEKFAKFEEELNKLGESQDFDGALVFVDKTLKESGFEGENKQQIIATKAMIYAQMKKFDEALKTVDEAKAFDPNSEIGKRMDGFKEQLEQKKNAPAEEEAVDEPEEAKKDAADDEKADKEESADDEKADKEESADDEKADKGKPAEDKKEEMKEEK
jgi:thioredoxin-related protein